MTARIGLLVLLLGAGALRAAYGATAFTITGVTPAVLDPAAGDVTVVTYVVPARANARLSFANAAGQEVTGVTLTYVAAATYTYTWTGKDTSNTPFAYGAYTVTLSGRTILGTTFGSATAGVTLQQTSLPPHAAGELGQTLGTFGTGNFELTKYGTVQFGIAFVAPYSDTLQGITLQWKSRPSPNYGAGTNGVYTFELQSDGVLHYPSGTVIARTTSIRPSDQLGTAGHCALHVPLTADLLVGEHYHLVLYNTDPNPAANWSSPNGAIVQVTPWTGGGCSGEQFNSPWGLTGQWCPYAIYPDSPGSTSLRDNGSHFPVMFTWARHGNSGDPYYGGLVPGTASNAMTLYGRNKYGQVMVWTQPSAAITRIGLLLLKKGSPTGNVLYHLEKVGGTEIVTGTLTSSSTVDKTVPKWFYATLPRAVGLYQGQTYRLWFEAPSGASSSNYVYQDAPYGESEPQAWIECGWGGSASCYQWNTSGTWNGWLGADLTFSLQ